MRDCAKCHLGVDARGSPLGAVLNGANWHDSVMLALALDTVPGVRSGKRAQPMTEGVLSAKSD